MVVGGIKEIRHHFSPVISISKPTNFRNDRPQYLVVSHFKAERFLIAVDADFTNREVGSENMQIHY
jgi:hypothetical protein